MPDHAVSIEAAHEFLRARLDRAPEGLEEVGEGAWSRCFGFVDSGRELVVRFGRFVDDFEKDRRAFGFLGAALPVPEVLEIGSAFGGHFAISTRARGEPLEVLAPQVWNETLPALFAALDAMRRLDVSSTTGFGLWGPAGCAPHTSWRDFLLAVDTDTPDRRTHGWRRRLAAAPGGDAVFRAGLERLGPLADAASGVRAVVHADLINRNVLARDGRLEAVFDWGCSFYGDFLYDLAWLDFWAPWHEAIARSEVAAAAKRHWSEIGLDVPDAEARLLACGIHIGLDHLAYNAYTGDHAALAQVTERLIPFLE